MSLQILQELLLDHAVGLEAGVGDVGAIGCVAGDFAGVAAAAAAGVGCLSRVSGVAGFILAVVFLAGVVGEFVGAILDVGSFVCAVERSFGCLALVLVGSCCQSSRRLRSQ